MSCHHGNWPPCDHCDEIDAAVAHATAARDAEVEALRAEVEKWKVPGREWLDKTEWVQQTIKPRELGRHRADILRERIQRSEARAERLAEALRVLADAFESRMADEENPDWHECWNNARALLREQEEGK